MGRHHGYIIFTWHHTQLRKKRLGQRVTWPVRVQHDKQIAGLKRRAYIPGASSWAPSLHEWWLCRQPGPCLIPSAGTAQRRCDPSASAPTFSLSSARGSISAAVVMDGGWRWGQKNQNTTQLASRLLEGAELSSSSRLAGP